ncbi:Undecaprenyl-phosphate 4-deoxy-4-formamido-L-arabinose transferase [subsurface metagenome]
MKGNSNPTVSVIIPTYNRAHLVSRAIESVLNQTYQDFEIIVVDDGSTDDTEEIVRSFKNERIRYIRHEKNKGAAAARNTGIKVAKGEYIAFQDSDDEWLPEKLEKQMKVFENVPQEVGVVYTDMWTITRNKKRYFYSPKIMPENKIIYKRVLNYGVMNIGIQTALIKKEAFDKAGVFDEKLPRFIDLELFIRLLKYYYFYHIKEPLVNYFHTPESISSNTKAIITARKFILDKYFEDIKKDKKVLANHYLGIGVSLCVNNEIEEGESYIAKAFKINSSIDRQLLSKHYFSIGVNLCSNNNFKNGRNYFIKAVKAYPFNIELLLAILLLSFGQGFYNKSIKIYRNIKRLIG